jgi:hypothetical protein
MDVPFSAGEAAHACACIAKVVEGERRSLPVPRNPVASIGDRFVSALFQGQCCRSAFLQSFECHARRAAIRAGSSAFNARLAVDCA